MRSRAPRLICAGLASCMSGCAWFRNPPPPSPDPGIDAAGLELPRALGPYRVALVQYSGDPEQGAFVRYLPADSSSALPRIDVIVYPDGGSRLPREIALSHDDLLEVDRTSPQIDGTALLDEGRFPLEAVGDTAYRAAYYVSVSNVPQRALVYLHATAGRFVKARTSFTFHPGFAPDARVDDVVEALFAVAAPIPVGRRP